MNSFNRFVVILLFRIILCEARKNRLSNCSNWEPFKDEKCYKLIDSTQLQNFDDAINVCYQLEGSSLASIRSQDEQNFLFNLLNNVNNIVNDVWLGIEFRLDSYKWIDSTALNYTNWANGNPINESGYDCIQLVLSEPYNGQWFNRPCSKKNVVVCEKMQNWMFSYLQKTVMEMRETISNITDVLDITYSDLQSTKLELLNQKAELVYYKSELNNILTNSSTGCSLSDNWAKCGLYVDFRTNKRQVLAIPKLLDEKFLPWDSASNVCQKYNANLISIESPEKQLFLENFVQTNRTFIWTSGQTAEDNIWRWINGNELSYTDWGPGQPDNGYPMEPCLHLINTLDVTNKWNDWSCVQSLLVVCEFDLTN